MPKKPIDYSKCCIYKIEHIDDDSLVYVGHTTNFDKRKVFHKHNCKTEKRKDFNFKVYQMMRENGGWKMFKMIEVEKYPCNDKREAERRENVVMKSLKASMNTYKSFMTKEEHNEYLKDYNKKYYQANKEKINKKENEKVKCLCGCEVVKQKLKQHQQTKKHIKLMENINIKSI